MVTIEVFGWKHRISRDGMVETASEGKDWGIRRPEEVGLTPGHAFIIRQHLKGLAADFPHTMQPVSAQGEPVVKPEMSGVDLR